MEIKLECDCGQHYAFDVEPVDGLMPVSVGCPSCGVDGTIAANAKISGITAASASAKPALPRMSMQRHTPEVKSVPVVVPQVPVSSAASKVVQTAGGRNSPPSPSVRGDSMPNLPMGYLGVVLGTAIGSGLAYWFLSATGFRLPFIGLITGLLAGYGGRWLCRGTDSSLGIAAGVFAFIGVAGTLAATGMFNLFSIISLFVTVRVAYRIASG